MVLPVLDVVAWVCVRDRQMLATRSRGRDAFYLPGGKRESGESDWEALSREVWEELNVRLVAETVKDFATVEAAAHGFAEPRWVQMKCFLADYIGTIAPSGEIEEITWLRHADLPRCAPASQQVLATLHDRRLID